jgi:hypothetical protein
MSNRFHTTQSITSTGNPGFIGTVTGDITGDVTGDVTGNISGYVTKAAGAVTTNSTGVAMGNAYDFVTLTSASADNIAILPTPAVGKVIRGAIGGTGCEIRSTAPTSVAINGVTGANKEAALAADSSFEAVSISATNWLLRNFTATGVETNPVAD